jgi:hypothetical protein
MTVTRVEPARSQAHVAVQLAVLRGAVLGGPVSGGVGDGGAPHAEHRDQLARGVLAAGVQYSSQVGLLADWWAAGSDSPSSRLDAEGLRTTLNVCVEIHGSARRHQVADEDIDHAYRHCLCWVEVGEDPTRYLLAGPDRAGNLLELVLLVGEDLELVIHAMALRESTWQVLFGPGEPR